MAYAMYLRKSRADLEAEARGEGETLARHKRILTELAKRQGLEIGEVYQEVVSGETLAARPEARRLLGDILAERWDGVLVMEIERLARGDTIDQGQVARAFTMTGTLIVTPIKTYDPTNEFDEEYFEFSLFMSRREYKTIRRRMQAGRVAAAKEGKYIGSIPPYGYRRIRTADGPTLEPDPVEAPIVKDIFSWYIDGIDGQRLGISLIARKLNSMGIPARHGAWTTATLRDMIKNPVYTGKIRWNSTKKRSRLPNDQQILVRGLHEPLIDEDTHQRAVEIITANRPAPIPDRKTIKSPLSGLMVCGVCGRKMVRRPYSNGRAASLICSAVSCNNISADLWRVETYLLESMQAWLDAYNVSPQSVRSDGTAEREHLNAISTMLVQAQAQKERLYDLLERGIYTDEEFIKRSTTLKKRLIELEMEREKATVAINNIDVNNAIIDDFIPRWQHVLESYPVTVDIQSKNALLKSVLTKVVYTRTKGGRWTDSRDNFTLELFPKLPKTGD